MGFVKKLGKMEEWCTSDNEDRGDGVVGQVMKMEADEVPNLAEDVNDPKDRAADKAAAKASDQVGSSVLKRKKKVGEPSRPAVPISSGISLGVVVDDVGKQKCLPNEQGDLRGSAADEAVAMSQGVERVREPLNVAPEIPSPTKPTPTPSSAVGTE
ncbi:hypothetical protein LWI29_029938 [Acer saccharum]|uniref:Uncharacterized protein n=1 Tax=Acer saccharum TaxID=4024 RepID=A0AA39W999_ACESA|nr:hypothetical protein LWI29_029938 [Acer saccharum]